METCCNIFGIDTMRDAKQIVVVRRDLNMRKGKIAIQCAHASTKVLLDLMITKLESDKTFRTFVTNNDSALEFWLENSFAKICVYVNSEEELDQIYNKAKEAGLLCSMIVDSGRTEFKGVPTKTVVAIGPAWCDEVDPITQHLPLL